MSITSSHGARGNGQRTVAHAVTALMALATGWFGHQSAMPTPVPQLPAKQPCARAPARVVAPESSAPFIVVSSDGNVTLRVEQQPLDWVLEQIAIQSGRPDVRQRASPAPERAAGDAPAQSAARASKEVEAAPALAACPETAARHVDPARVLQNIEGGTEAERFQGLMLAQSAGITVAEPTLKQLFETGESERVQVAAFEAYLALRADRPDALRAALEEAQHAPTASIQREGRRRLDELQELQRLDALPPLLDP